MKELFQKRAEAPFVFSDFEGLVMPTGLKAGNLREFLEILRQVPADVIRHHLYRTFLSIRFEVWDYPNDFARWAANALEDHALAEKLAALDPYSERDLERAREEITDLVEDHLDSLPGAPWVRPGLEFHFSSGHFIALPSERQAWTLQEFRDALAHVPLHSVYYHFHEARLRGSDDGLDDFSRWISTQFGENGIVRELRRVDFYFYSLSDIRQRILTILDDAARGALS